MPKILFGVRYRLIGMAKQTETGAKKKPIEQYDHKGKIEETLIEACCGTVSLPFVPGKNGRVAVKIEDDRGIESLKVMELP